MHPFTVEFAVVAVAVFVLTVLFERILIPILRSHKLGQRILDIGPRWHKSKEGTPTMGGIGFILAALLVMLGYFIYHAVLGDVVDLIPLALTLSYAVFNGVIGFVDDYCKLVKKQNEGLTRLQKLFLQLVLAGAYVCVMSYTGNMSTVLVLPFGGKEIDLGVFWYLLVILILAGVVNGGNITDGIDGLASSITFVIGGFFTVVAFACFDRGVSIVGAVLMGATLGFLIYNFHPARVFMGDTGSLFLGAMVIGAALQMQRPIVGIVVSSVFIVEMLTSFLQILYFKCTRKRLFRMAPLHHHLEKGGWSEYRIVLVFSLIEAAVCVLGWFLM